MMHYFMLSVIFWLTTVLFLLGVGFHIMQKIKSLRGQFPMLEPGKVFQTFFQQEWDSLIVSLLVLTTWETMIYLWMTKRIVLAWVTDGQLYLISPVIGYAGQYLAYKWLATAQVVLEKKVENLK